MKIYTKRGDSGKTDLFGGERVSKTHQRVRAYGSVDSANSVVGFVAAAKEIDLSIKILLNKIMSDLFDVGAELATAENVSAQSKLQNRLDTMIDEGRIVALENEIDLAEEQLPALKSFVLPTGSEVAARFHLARTAVRQAEVEVMALREQGGFVRDEILQYLNRLSDLMFVLARLANHQENIADVYWEAKKHR